MVSRIDVEESDEEIRVLWGRVEAARDARDAHAELDACWALLEHPCAHHQVVEHEVLDDVFQVLRRMRRFDEAIQAKREAIDAGFRSNPDPEADIAECLVEAGRREEADALFAELRRRDPDDVWLYNSAGWAYSRVDDREALRWLRDGIAVAFETGDADQVVGQLLGMAQGCWERLGEPGDAVLVARVEAFERDWVRPPYRPSFAGGASPVERGERRCGHCGFDPDRPGGSMTTWVGPSRRTEPVKALVAVAWFPAGERPAAVERWPDLADGFEPPDAYDHRIEARLKWLARQQAGSRLAVSPLRVAELLDAEGDDAGTGEGRARLAAEMARLGRAIAWPPGRNDMCWCGSGRKYKKCCGPVPAAEDEDR